AGGGGARVGPIPARVRGAAARDLLRGGGPRRDARRRAAALRDHRHGRQPRLGASGFEAHPDRLFRADRLGAQADGILRSGGLAGHAGTELLYDPDVFSYIRRFNALLARADALWSKPSELTFFAGLGLPFIAAPPVGAHEERNLRWATDRGAALPQHDPQIAGQWLLEWVEDGVLASAAEAGMCL